MISGCIQTILFCMVFNSKLMNMMTHLVDFTSLIFPDGQDISTSFQYILGQVLYRIWGSGCDAKFARLCLTVIDACPVMGFSRV